MIAETGFRVMLGASIAAGIVGVIVMLLSEASLPLDLQRYVSGQAAAPITLRDLLVLVLWAPGLVVSLIGAIGMFFFWRPARILALIGTLVTLAALPFAEAIVASGIATLFNEASSILWGTVLALAYWSPVAQRFEKPGNPA